MGIPNALLTGKSGLMAAKSAIATTGHNISNANTEGYSRQRVELASKNPVAVQGVNTKMGSGVMVKDVKRINDEYLEKQIRNASNEMGNLDEKTMLLQQVEEVFNEVEGDGLNQVMAKFFNNFRQLANDPSNEAIRHTVRESTDSMVKTIRRLNKEVNLIKGHVDARISGHAKELNSLSEQVSKLNLEIDKTELNNLSANDLRDRRDLALKKMSELLDISVHQDEAGSLNVDVKGIGPLVSGPRFEEFSTGRTQADGLGKPDNSVDLIFTGSVSQDVTREVSGGKVGALIEIRDEVLSDISNRLDEIAFTVSRAVNQVHRQGFSQTGLTGVNYFKELGQKERAAEFLELSDEIKGNVNNIATGASPNSPGDNRIAVAISGLQHLGMMSGGTSTVDEFYNSIVGDVGVLHGRVKSDHEQQSNIMTQINKFREQVSGVSIDEETTNLLQFQHSYDASAKVIAVADEMLETVLNLG